MTPYLIGAIGFSYSAIIAAIAVIVAFRYGIEPEQINNPKN